MPTVEFLSYPSICSWTQVLPCSPTDTRPPPSLSLARLTLIALITHCTVCNLLLCTTKPDKWMLETMAAQPDNTSSVPQPGSVSNGNDNQAPAEPSHLSGDRVAAYTPDKVVVRASSGTTDVALRIEQHRARGQRILEKLEPMLPLKAATSTTPNTSITADTPIPPDIPTTSTSRPPKASLR
ncbi:hypothetical protein GE09DRAFT_1294116 [Coniochaeta sp. 2T2.1]|nr:hypothetical protein GE09DRAFT_1294116 [Coniochaeta sp. 2T2.1]